MAGSNLKKFKRPEVLRELTFKNLITLLRRFKGYFERVNFIFEGKTEEDFDYDGLVAVLAGQMFIGEYEELFNAFALIGAMSAENRDDLLREFIGLQKYANELTDEMSTADMALLVYLHDPDALNDIDIQFNATKKRSFAMHAAKPDISGLEITNEQIEKFEQLMNDVFAAKNRGRTARIYPPTLDGGELQIVIRHGESFKRQGAVMEGRTSKTLAFQPESFDLLVINRAAGELRVCVPSEPKWLGECYKGNLGKALFDDYEAFSLPRVNDLERIKELGRKVLIYHGSLELRMLALLSLTAYFTADTLMKHTLTASSGDLFRDLEEADFDLTTMGTILEAKFLVKIGSRERTITLKNSNRSGYDYDDFGIIVDDWLRSVGVIHTLNSGGECGDVEATDSVEPVAAAV